MKAACYGILATVAITLTACGNFAQTSLRAGVSTGNSCLDAINSTCTMEYSPATCHGGNFSSSGGNACSATYAVRKQACQSGMSADQVQQMQINCTP